LHFLHSAYVRTAQAKIPQDDLYTRLNTKYVYTKTLPLRDRITDCTGDACRSIRPSVVSSFCLSHIWVQTVRMKSWRKPKNHRLSVTFVCKSRSRFEVKRSTIKVTWFAVAARLVW